MRLACATVKSTRRLLTVKGRRRWAPAGVSVLAPHPTSCVCRGTACNSCWSRVSARRRRPRCRRRPPSARLPRRCRRRPARRPSERERERGDRGGADRERERRERERRERDRRDADRPRAVRPAASPPRRRMPPSPPRGSRRWPPCPLPGIASLLGVDAVPNHQQDMQMLTLGPACSRVLVSERSRVSGATAWALC